MRIIFMLFLALSFFNSSVHADAPPDFNQPQILSLIQASEEEGIRCPKNERAHEIGITASLEEIQNYKEASDTCWLVYSAQAKSYFYAPQLALVMTKRVLNFVSSVMILDQESRAMGGKGILAQGELKAFRDGLACWANPEECPVKPTLASLTLLGSTDLPHDPSVNYDSSVRKQISAFDQTAINFWDSGSAYPADLELPKNSEVISLLCAANQAQPANIEAVIEESKKHFFQLVANYIDLELWNMSLLTPDEKARISSDQKQKWKDFPGNLKRKYPEYYGPTLSHLSFDRELLSRLRGN